MRGQGGGRRGDEEESESAMEEVTDATAAVRQVLKNALAVGGVVRGFREVCRHVRCKRAQVVFLAESCDEQDKVGIVLGLCQKDGVPLVRVPKTEQTEQHFGKWAGADPRKVRPPVIGDAVTRTGRIVTRRVRGGASFLCVTSYGEQGMATST
ncbi:unnamed protein product [Prorocentrum cordatum]|uniref:Ribosomal protein eL8/eL30/eS12/Gadd45 domain-containing protein n=1 Tax=Prorocentrum cordatum TaxID=2364126 RepID=A0ABN9U9Y5_9DINO|nr:unnamed protein product [Polarella glacialis]